MQLASLHMQAGDYVGAVDWFEEAHLLYPTDARAMQGLVMALMQAGN